MEILLISYYYSDQDSTGSLRARAMAKYLPLYGVNVTILTSSIQKSAIKFDKNVIFVKDINHLSTNIIELLMRASRKLLRMLGVYRGIHSYWLSQANKNSDAIINFAKPKIILASYPCIEALEIGYRLAKNYNLPLVIDFRDGLLFEPLETTLLSIPCVRYHYMKIEKQVACAANLVISICDPISNYFAKTYRCNNLLTLPNGFDDDLKHQTVSSDYESINWDEGSINIVHTGRVGLSGETSLGDDRGIAALCTALTILQQNSAESLYRVRFHFVGQLSSHERAILLPFTQTGLVFLWGQLKRPLAIEFQRRATYLLLITTPDRVSVASGKIFEYLVSNKKILALTRGTEAEKIIKETGSGIVISPDNPIKIAENLRFIFDGGQLNCVRNEPVISSYSRNGQMKILAKRLNELLC